MGGSRCRQSASTSIPATLLVLIVLSECLSYSNWSHRYRQTTTRLTLVCCRLLTRSSSGSSSTLHISTFTPCTDLRPVSFLYRWKSQFASDDLYREILLVLSQFTTPYLELFKVRSELTLSDTRTTA